MACCLQIKIPELASSPVFVLAYFLSLFSSSETVGVKFHYSILPQRNYFAESLGPPTHGEGIGYNDGEEMMFLHLPRDSRTGRRHTIPAGVHRQKRSQSLLDEKESRRGSTL